MLIIIIIVIIINYNNDDIHDKNLCKKASSSSKLLQDLSRTSEMTPKRPLTAPKMRQRGSKRPPRDCKRLRRENFEASGKIFEASKFQGLILELPKDGDEDDGDEDDQGNDGNDEEEEDEDEEEEEGRG